MSKRCDSENQANSYFRGDADDRRRQNIGSSSAYRRMFCQTRDTFLIVGRSPARVAKSLCHSRCVSSTAPPPPREKEKLQELPVDSATLLLFGLRHI